MSQTLSRYLTYLFKTEQVDEAKALWLETALSQWSHVCSEPHPPAPSPFGEGESRTAY